MPALIVCRFFVLVSPSVPSQVSVRSFIGYRLSKVIWGACASWYVPLEPPLLRLVIRGTTSNGFCAGLFWPRLMPSADVLIFLASAEFLGPVNSFQLEKPKLNSLTSVGLAM